MSRAPVRNLLTVGEYLSRESGSLEKHEYRDGEIISMAGGTADRSLISANLIGELGNHLKGKPCRVYDSNLRVKIARSVLYTYPDATVICGKRDGCRGVASLSHVFRPRLAVQVDATDRDKAGNDQSRAVWLRD